MRLDHYLFKYDYIHSRNQAKELIVNHKVRVNGKVISKPSFEVTHKTNPTIQITQNHIYVSRAAEKLKQFLKMHPVDIAEEDCLDIGSSTGGFIQVLLEAGAASITGVDVGKAQLHEMLRKDARVISIEQTDIRCFKTPKVFNIVTCDVSFVGIVHIMADIDRLAKRDIIILFKPQFEVGKDVNRTKKGVVKDQKVIDRVRQKFESNASRYGWELIVCEASQVKGKEGNVEIFYHFRKK